MKARSLVVIGIILLLAWGCVPPQEPLSGHIIRVAVLQGADSLRLSSHSTLTIKDAASGKVLYSSRRGGPAVLTSSAQSVTVAGKPYRVRTLLATSSSGKIFVNAKAYPGTFKILHRPDGFLVVNLVDLSTYLKAVVPSEMLPTWPAEALKAQAVVSRSFALFHAFRNNQKDFDITSSTQIYDPDKRDARTDRAVDATRNIVLFYKGRLFLPFFCTSCGGFTEYASNVWESNDPFPPTVECPFCRDAPDYRWEARMTLGNFRQKLRAAGMSSVRSIAVQSRSASGRRITALKVLSDDGDKVIRINRFRLTLGQNLIRSGFFDFQVKDGYIVFSGRGWGHGVGMCQRGAKALAERGESSRGILQYYFPGARMKRLGS